MFVSIKFFLYSNLVVGNQPGFFFECIVFNRISLNRTWSLSISIYLSASIFFLFSALIVSLCFSVCGPFLCLSVNILCLCNLYLVLLVSLGVLCSCNNCTVVHVALSLCIYFKLSENNFLCMQFWYCRFWYLVFSFFFLKDYWRSNKIHFCICSFFSSQFVFLLMW